MGGAGAGSTSTCTPRLLATGVSARGWNGAEWVCSAAMADPKVLVIVLAGGEGKRLLPLTHDRAKPAVPVRRLVPPDRFRAVELRQRRAHSRWSCSRSTRVTASTVTSARRGASRRCSATTSRRCRRRCVAGPFWFSGSADAIYQNLNLISDESPDLVCVFGADHIYRMDPQQMIDHHVEVGGGRDGGGDPGAEARGARVRRDRVRRRRADPRLPREGRPSRRPCPATTSGASHRWGTTCSTRRR